MRSMTVCFPEVHRTPCPDFGEASNRIVTGEHYDHAYYDANGMRHDLLAELKGAIAWCDRELAAIEGKVT